MPEPCSDEFERLAASQTDPPLLAEFWAFLRHNKKWWLLPLLLVLGGMVLLAMFAASPAAPFIYPLF